MRDDGLGRVLTGYDPMKNVAKEVVAQLEKREHETSNFNVILQGAPARLRLSFADGKLGVLQLLPCSCAHSARIPPAQAQLGRLSNISELINQT